MNEELDRFLLNNAIASKLSGRPVVGQHGGRKFVFVHGYPMTLAGFYIISTKAIFGASLHLASRRWEELHAETQLLCRGLGMELQRGREAFSVLRGIRTAMNWSRDSYGKERILRWISEVEDGINQMG